MNADETYTAVRNTVAWFDTGEEGRFRLGGPQFLELAGALMSSDPPAASPHRPLCGSTTRKSAIW